MNKRSIEEYIKENKKEFDFKTPSDQLWARIDAGLDKAQVKKKSGMPFWFGIAASLMLIMTVTFIYTYRKGNRQELEIADINPVYGKKEMKFASQIEEKKDSLQVYAKKNPVLYAKFSADLNQLDGDYEKMKKELQNSPNQEVVVRAMVKNLELQLQVINQQLSIINEVNQYKEENQI
ncbi:hypothetical protein [Pedobacter gandavensis]|uniref:hypothetical protein n=1 Tax=Pedobacter gandavensis TaxID=2679963 RepID=UPI00292EA82D|nr:hypothetical protein [Pedobacter gandavensis]